jgi:hypothetical protein
MAHDLTTTNILHGETIMPNTDNLPTLRNNISTRVALKTTVMVAEAQAKVEAYANQREVSRRTLREHEAQHNLRLDIIKHDHRMFKAAADKEYADLLAELNTLKGK